MPTTALKSLSCPQHSELLIILQHRFFPCSSKHSPSTPLSRLPLRGIRVVFLKQFSSKLETEAKVILTLLIKLVGGETDAGEPSLYTSFLERRLTGDHAILYTYIYVQAL